MPDHVRKQIRDSAVSQLASTATAAGRVYGTRRKSMDALPAVAVYIGEETIEPLASSPFSLARNLELHIEGYAAASSNVEDTLDTLAAEIEAEITDETFGGAAKGASLENISTQFWEDDANKHFALIRLTYSVIYATEKGAATVAL